VEGLFVLASLLVALVAFDFAAVTRGVDSRDESSDPRSPVRPTGIVA
jgi:hypothetical protein